MDDAIEFNMPSGFVGAQEGDCGRIPNSTIIGIYFKTEKGSGWLGDSGWLIRIPDGGTVTFEISATGLGNWNIG